MIQSKLHGTGVALVTPFTKSGEIDFNGLEKLINHCIAGGVNYLVSLGTTGENVTLTKEEKLDVLNFHKNIKKLKTTKMRVLCGCD